MIRRLSSHIVVFSCILFSASVWGSDDDELGVLDDAYGGEEFVSIATGSQQLLSRAPAVASVITSEEIDRMGATDLNQVLETVPGLHVSASTTAFNPIYEIRGIHSDNNAQVLMLVNGIPITNVFAGNRGQVWGGMPVRNIERVEVIRGPGSAVYGADAFAGVINIITKTAHDLDGLEIGFRAGNYDMKEGWLQYGGSWDDLQVAFSFQAGETDGYKRTIGIDSQSFFDQSFGTDASLAPASVSTGRRYVDTSLDLGWQNWRLRAGWQGRDRVGTGPGFAQALDPSGSSTSSRFNADLTYDKDNLFEDWDFTAQLSFFNVDNTSDLTLFPAGAGFPVLGPNGPVAFNVFPQGVMGSPDVSERHYRIQLSGYYTGFSNHAVRTGAGFRFEDMYDVKEQKNFFQAGNPFPIPLPPGRPSTPFLTPHSRTVSYVFVQDEWNLYRDWTLTSGLRYDYYSDFGSTINPRLALVWQTTRNLTSKVLYGRAFRAPSFGEQFNTDEVPLFQGNPDLKPETINTVELAFDYHPQTSVGAKMNLYWYLYEDIIRPVADNPPVTRTFQNAGDQTGYGIELETRWDVLENLRLTANYAFQYSEDDSTGSDVGFAPSHQLYARADWQFLPDWNFNVQSNWVGQRKRPRSDRRPQVADYLTFDMTLRGDNILENWGVSASVWNLFDADVREPSPPFDNPASSLVPGDFPMAGRSFYFELRYKLK